MSWHQQSQIMSTHPLKSSSKVKSSRKHLASTLCVLSHPERPKSLVVLLLWWCSVIDFRRWVLYTHKQETLSAARGQLQTPWRSWQGPITDGINSWVSWGKKKKNKKLCARAPRRKTVTYHRKGSSSRAQSFFLNSSQIRWPTREKFHHPEDSCRASTDTRSTSYALIHWEKLQCQQWSCRR